ncbi:unnamed protein product [Rhizoctonia solani]|uniref:Uncharacterized protein n=1 Tax=Rhizoctonia solani TaxID=456999 RepID=A0A8H3CR34_9AGAM|nr:unnamed protein product [Rhizoctonia solani]
MILPSGEKAKIKWLTVGGRTSALVEQLQKMPAGGRDKSKKAHVEPDSDGEDQDNEPGTSKTAPTKTRKRKTTRGADKADDPALEDGDSSDLTEIEEETKAKPVKRARKTVAQVEQKVVRKGLRGKAEAAGTSTRVTRSASTAAADNEPVKKASRSNKRSTK